MSKMTVCIVIVDERLRECFMDAVHAVSTTEIQFSSVTPMGHPRTEGEIRKLLAETRPNILVIGDQPDWPAADLPLLLDLEGGQRAVLYVGSKLRRESINHPFSFAAPSDIDLERATQLIREQVGISRLL